MIRTLHSVLSRIRNRTRKGASLVDLLLLKHFNRLPKVEIDLKSMPVDILPAILEDICLPPYHGPDNHDDFLPLMRFIRLLCPRLVVELGTAHGNTVANICNQCPDATVYTVNALAEEQTGEIVTYSLTREEVGRVYRTMGFESRVVQIFENTLCLNLSDYLDRQPIDLAIIDACHDTEYVINDFLKVNPFVRAEGVVLFHDTHPSMEGHLAGSYVACMKLRRKGFDIRYVENTWWAIWVNSGDVTGSLKKLGLAN
jgi:methyltransferase family protein